MSQAHAQKFYEIVSKDPAMFEMLISDAKDPQEFIARAVAEAGRQGLEFSPQEADALLLAQAQKMGGELSDQQLEAVAGGKSKPKGPMAQQSYWDGKYGTFFGQRW